MTKDHDSSYKLLFSEPEIIIDLLQGFVYESWVKELDFSTLEKVSGSYISDDLRSREDDLIWRVKYQHGWIYVYLLIEFQSTVDKFMAVRLMTYMGLLYQDLIKTKQLTPNRLLPPIFPVVLYNGENRWDAAIELKDLIVKLPGGLEKHLPSLSYLLLDEGAFEAKALSPLKNLVAAIFRLENANSDQDIIDVLNNLVEWLSSPEQARLRRSFTVWINRVVLKAYDFDQAIDNINDLVEIRSMLAQRIVKWNNELKQQVWNDGLEKGMAEGLIHEKSLLLKLILCRFDKLTSETALDCINPISDTGTLERIGEWIITCPDAGSFLAKLKGL